MRATKRRRPAKRHLAEDDRVNVDEIIDTVHYVGSPEHKDSPSFAGHPRPRADATICDRRFLSMQSELTEWLRTALRKNAYGYPMEGNYPRYIWFKDGSSVYEGRLVNREQGSYKGYELQPDEWPKGIEGIYDA